MTTPTVLITKRKFLVGKTAWLIGLFSVIILLGFLIQVKMTWERERLRSVTSEANDAVNVAKTGFSAVLPKSSVFQSLFDFFQSSEPTSSTNP